MNQPTLFDIPATPLDELRAQVEEGRDAGCTCPVCDQFCKVYKRKLNSGMAACLCWMVKAYAGEWIDVPRTAPRHVITSNEHGKMVHWGLVEQQPNQDDPSKKGSGLWRPTGLGVAFARGRVTVAKHAYLYNNHLHRFSDEQTTIQEALGDKFNYAELMGHPLMPAGDVLV